MKQQLLYLGILLAAPVAGLAQTARRVPSPISSFVTADYKVATSPDSAVYCVETTFRDSLSAVTRVYYASGNLKQYLPYGNFPRRLLHGTLSTWYEDGQMCTKQEYLNGQRDGELLTFYPDGTPKRRERYEKGRCGVGNCYGPDGQPVPYFTYEQLPLYPGGEAQLAKELAKAVRLNAQEMAAMRRESNRYGYMSAYGYQRQVDVELAVAPDGRITNARVVHSTAGFLNAAALRAVSRLKRQFVPGRRDGQLTASLLTVPVFYNMEMPYRSNYNHGRQPTY